MRSEILSVIGGQRIADRTHLTGMNKEEITLPSGESSSDIAAGNKWEGRHMYKRRKRIAAALISTTLILSNLASILPQGIVYASDGTTQEEQSQDEGLHEVYVPEEPIPAEEPAPVQAPAEENAGNEEASGESAGAEAPADAQTAELSVNAEAAEQPAAAPEAGMDAAAAASDTGLESDAAEQEGSAALIDGEEAAENGASASAESSGAGESGEANAVTIYYIADEGGSVSVPSEIVRAAEGGQASGSEAVAADGYTFTGWITLDGTVVCTDALFVPGVTPEMTGEVKYTAHFEKAAEEVPATRMVTAEYAAGKGGSVSRTSETVDALAEGAAFLGSTAAAEDGYAFVNWTAADGTEVSKDVTFVPAVGQDTAEKSVYTANFKKIITMPAQDFEGTAGSVHVSVHADEGNFPEGTTMHLKTVSTSSILNNDSVQDAVGKDREVVDAVAVDITFQDKEGNEIEPAGTISVRMTTSSRVEGESHEVLHIDDNGNASAVTSASATGASFDAGEFSIYVITGIGTAEQDPAIATYIFHDADGNVIADFTQKVKNGETVYAPTTPEKNGHKFVGWAYTKDAATLQEGDPGVFDQLTASVNTTGDVNLYPVFQQVYYVFFMDYQGRVSTTKEGASGNSISVSDVVIPLDSTQSVTGWYTDSELTEESKVKDSVKLTNHNVTLYPKVEKGNYLYFVSGEGASYVKPAFVAAGKETAAPKVPTRPGYTFRFWSATENGSAYKFGEKITKDTTLYAVWNAKKDTKYTIIYWWENANDEDYSYHKHEEKSGTTGSTINIKSISETYEGFTLNEDKTSEANNGVTISGDGSTIVNIYYSRNTYTISFFYSKWEGGWLSGSFYWYEMTSLRINAKYGANISDKWPTSTSKIWGTKYDEWGQGVAPYQSGISTMPLDGDEFYYVSKNGKYTINLNYLLEDLDGNEYVLDHTDSFKSDNSEWHTTKEDHYDIEGFSYAKNVKDGTKFGSTGNRWVYEVSFKYNRNNYSINFVNGASKSSQTFKYGADISKVDLKTPPTRPLGTPVMK